MWNSALLVRSRTLSNMPSAFGSGYGKLKYQIWKLPCGSAYVVRNILALAKG